MVRIGIVGDFDARHHTHVAINAALEHTSEALGEPLQVDWLPTPEVSDRALAHYDAIWAAPASPYRSMGGMLRGIEYARSRNVPFTGT
jgi:CTP synthase (UTP-ammonia lyase)